MTVDEVHLTPDDVVLPAGVRQRVSRLVQDQAHEMIAFRRRLHAEPEPSFAEVATTDAVIERLLVEDLNPVRLLIGTGVVCDVGPGAPRVALRADIDALPVHELADVPFASRVPGVAHVCGHDVHTAAVLGAGLVLARLAREGMLDRAVRLIFEPGEEQVPGGAVSVIDEGWAQGLRGIYAVHCQPALDVGQAALRVGPITSASDSVEITITGPGGHTARPDLTVNLIEVLGSIVSQLPRMVEQRVAGAGPVRLVFGMVRAGEAPNAIPNSAIIRGSLRTPSLQVWDVLPAALRDSLADLLAGTGAQWSLDHVRGVAPVDNAESATRVLAAAAAAVLGPESLSQAEQSWGGDSFGWFTREVPGSYLRLGTHNPDWQHRTELHNAMFAVDERAIALAVEILVLAALTRH